MNTLITLNSIGTTLSTQQIQGLMTGDKKSATQLTGFEAFKNYFIQLLNKFTGTNYFDKEQYLKKTYSELYPQNTKQSTPVEAWTAITSLLYLMDRSDRNTFEFQFNQNASTLFITHDNTQLTPIHFEKNEENRTALSLIEKHFTQESTTNIAYRELKTDIISSNQIKKIQPYIKSNLCFEQKLKHLEDDIEYLKLKWGKYQDNGSHTEMQKQYLMLKDYARLNITVDYLRDIAPSAKNIEQLTQVAKNAPTPENFASQCRLLNSLMLSNMSHFWNRQLNEKKSVDLDEIAKNKKTIDIMSQGWRSIHKLYVRDEKMHPCSLISPDTRPLLTFFTNAFDLLTDISNYEDNAASEQPTEKKLTYIKAHVDSLIPKSPQVESNNSFVYTSLKAAIIEYIKHTLPQWQHIARHDAVRTDAFSDKITHAKEGTEKKIRTLNLNKENITKIHDATTYLTQLFNGQVEYDNTLASDSMLKITQELQSLPHGLNNNNNTYLIFTEQLKLVDQIHQRFSYIDTHLETEKNNPTFPHKENIQSIIDKLHDIKKDIEKLEPSILKAHYQNKYNSLLNILNL